MVKRKSPNLYPIIFHKLSCALLQLYPYLYSRRSVLERNEKHPQTRTAPLSNGKNIPSLCGTLPFALRPGNRVGQTYNQTSSQITSRATDRSWWMYWYRSVHRIRHHPLYFRSRIHAVCLHCHEFRHLDGYERPWRNDHLPTY